MRNLALIVVVTILLAFYVNPICRATADAPIAGTIDATLFRQLPSNLVVAQTYTLIARVTNTGIDPTQYELFIRIPLTQSKTPIALSTSIANFKLNPGDTKEVSFTLTPVKAEDEPFDISASLYALAPNGSILLLSTATTTVRLIRIAPSQPLVLALLALMVSSAFAWIALHYGRNAKHKKELVTSATLFAASLLIRSYNYMRVGVYQDEVIFTNQALQILSNNWRWTFYQMQNYAYPPIYIYLNALFIYLFGYGLENTRWISILAGSSLPILIYLVGSRMYSQKTGLLAALMFLLSGEAILYSVIIRAESLTLFFLILAVYLFWVAESGGLRRWYLASGMVVGLAFDTKYTAIVTAMGFVLYFLWSRWSLKAFFDRKIALWILGFLLAIAPVQAYLMVSGANPYITFISTWITPSLQGGGSASTGFAPPKPTGVFNYLFRAFRVYVYEATRAGSP